MADKVTVHRFEAAGLGKAPFQILGVEMRVGPITMRSKDGVEVTIGAPGQPMGSCKFCGQGIKECWVIRSADGNVFDVGCDCVRKTGDRGLVAQLAPHEKKKRAAAKERKVARGEAVIAEAMTLLELPEVRARLAAVPHRLGFKDRETGRALTELDDLEWLLERAGHSGRLRAAKRIIEVSR